MICAYSHELQARAQEPEKKSACDPRVQSAKLWGFWGFRIRIHKYGVG